MKKKNSGITLIALVITIIVLLILAGVALTMVAGNEGILTKAETAVSQTNEASAKEQVELMLAELSADYYEKKFVDKTESGNLVDYIKNALATAKTTSNGEFSVKVDGNNVTVLDKNGNAIVSGTLNENGKTSWSDSTGTNSAPEISAANYGEYVDLGTSLIVNDNIALEDGTLPETDWRIFHKDASGGVWLILADYLPNSYETTVGSGLEANEYFPYWWVAINRTDYLTRLGNSNAWNNLIPSQYVEKGLTVTGAIDLETWVESWNTSDYTELFTNRYSNVNGSSQSDGLDGYYIGTVENPESDNIDLSSDAGYGNTLYFPHKWVDAREDCCGYVLASPSAEGTDIYYMMSVTCIGYVGDFNWNDYVLGIRPAVYIPVGISLEKNAEGHWEIK